MITWAIRENIRNPMPDYSSSPLETLNNIWDINPNDKGSTDKKRLEGKFELRTNRTLGSIMVHGVLF